MSSLNSKRYPTSDEEFCNNIRKQIHYLHWWLDVKERRLATLRAYMNAMRRQPWFSYEISMRVLRPEKLRERYGDDEDDEYDDCDIYEYEDEDEDEDSASAVGVEATADEQGPPSDDYQGEREEKEQIIAPNPRLKSRYARARMENEERRQNMASASTRPVMRLPGQQFTHGDPSIPPVLDIPLHLRNPNPATHRTSSPHYSDDETSDDETSRDGMKHKKKDSGNAEYTSVRRETASVVSIMERSRPVSRGNERKKSGNTLGLGVDGSSH